MASLPPELEAEVFGDTEQQQAEAERQYARIRMIVSRLDRLAQEQVAHKILIEERWLDDLRAYYGRYSDTVEKELKGAQKSRLFVKLTRQKTHGWQARLSDMLFPTEDKNWGISPTPVPALTKEAGMAAREAQRLTDEANRLNEQGATPEATRAATSAQLALDKAAELQAQVDEARKRCEAMDKHMTDQLVECRYGPRARDVIDDGCRLGTGIMRGPTVAMRMRRAWQNDGGAWSLASALDPRPDFSRVDPWSFFPDMSACSIDESEFEFERFLPNKRTLKTLAREVGFDPQAVARILKSEPKDSVPNYITQLRSMVNGQHGVDQRYQIWCYHGCLEAAEVQAIYEAMGDPDGARLLEEEDPLKDYRVIVWFGEGELLKIGLHPLDSGESLYSVWNFEKDDTSIFGYGVPFLMRDSQAALNGAWRMMMDNAGLSVGPQVVVDTTKIKPASGDWDLAPRKVWLSSEGWEKTNPPFQVFDVPNNQGELNTIIERAKEFADDETNMPVIAQGEQGPQVTQTMGGMSILMNSANVVFRRVVKNWDDDMTTPNIRRLYDWNMQFNPDDSVKGDYQVDARGSSVLLVKEIASQNLLAIAERWTTHPVLGAFVKALPAARKTVQSMMITADEVLKTDDEVRREQEAMQNQQQAPSPDEIKLRIAEMDRQTKLDVAGIEREVALYQLAESGRIDMAKVEAIIAKAQLEMQSKERMFAAEAAIETRNRAEDRASGGSGGYFSMGQGGQADSKQAAA